MVQERDRDMDLLRWLIALDFGERMEENCIVLLLLLHLSSSFALIPGCLAACLLGGREGEREYNTTRQANHKNRGLISANRSNEATLPLTIPRSLLRSSTKDLCLIDARNNDSGNVKRRGLSEPNPPLLFPNCRTLEYHHLPSQMGGEGDGIL